MSSEVREQPFFSIVMPVYGVEKYITKAVQSILAQTYENWEIVLVDDCTPDQSIHIAQKAAKGDPRIRVVRHEQNKGLSEARNTGIREAEGSYIWFMDPDDYVEKDILEKVKKSLDRNLAEVVMFGLTEEYYNQDGTLEYTHTIAAEEKLFDNQKELRKKVIQYEQETLYGYAWNKIYRLQYIRENSFRYKNVKLIEDIVFNIEFFMDIQRLNVLAATPYHYAKRLSGNLTNKFVPEYFEVHRRRIELLYEQYQYWEICTDEVKQILGSLYGRYIVSALERNCDKRSNMTHSDRYKWCRAVFCQGLFEDLIPKARAKDSKTLSFALLLLRWKRSMLCLAMGRGIHMIRSGLPMVYSKVKSGR